ncbi:MAG: metallophosphoesterase [Verrucomicrobiales bacterium]
MTRIIHLSDPHFGAMDGSVENAFLDCAAAMKPDVTILSGDLTMSARRSELIAARAFVARLPLPHLVIPGNHDIPTINHPWDRFFHPFRRFQDFFGPTLEPELTVPGVHIISLNSSKPFGFHADWSEGRLTQQQLAALKARFDEAPPLHRRILVLHHPLVELQLPGRAVVKPLKDLLEQIEIARVDVVMCGHFHRSQILLVGITDRWKAVLSQAPTVCSTRLQGEPQGFHELVITDNRIELIRHVYEDGEFIKAGFSVFSGDESGWSHAHG